MNMKNNDLMIYFNFSYEYECVNKLQVFQYTKNVCSLPVCVYFIKYTQKNNRTAKKVMFFNTLLKIFALLWFTRFLKWQ